MFKKVFILGLILLSLAVCFAADYDVVRCKNGKMYIGKMIEYNVFDLYRMRIGSSVMNIHYNDILSVQRMPGDAVSAMLDSLGADNPDIKFPSYSHASAVYFQIGITSSEMLDLDFFDTKPLTGYDVAVMYSSDLSPRNRRVMGLHYLTKGSGFKGTSTTVTLNYLQLSLEYSRLLPINKKASVNLNAGVAPAFLIRATRAEPYVPPIPEKQNISESIMHELSSFDFGLLGGIGFNYGKTSLNIQYNRGLSKVNILQKPKNYNSCLSATLGIRL